jgi:hypothetical protein
MADQLGKGPRALTLCCPQNGYDATRQQPTTSSPRPPDPPRRGNGAPLTL